MTQIGIWAPVLLIVLRCFQGLALGGEVDRRPDLRDRERARRPNAAFSRVLFRSVARSAALMAAAGAGALVALLSDADLVAWGWRIPFLISTSCWSRSASMCAPSVIRIPRIHQGGCRKSRRSKFRSFALFQRAKKPLAIVFVCGLGESAMVNFFSVFGLFYALQAYGLAALCCC